MNAIVCWRCEGSAERNTPSEGQVQLNLVSPGNVIPVLMAARGK